MKKLSYLLLSCLAVAILNSCVTSPTSVSSFDIFNTRYDQVKEQYRQNTSIHFTPGWGSAFTYQSAVQELVKFSNPDSSYTLLFYDNILVTDQVDYELEPTFYLIVDEKIFQIDHQRLSTRDQNGVITNTEDVLLADSTRQTVVTDQQFQRQRVISSKYEFPPEALALIPHAKDVIVRYYYGPNIIDLDYGYNNLFRLKRFINFDPKAHIDARQAFN